MHRVASCAAFDGTSFQRARVMKSTQADVERTD